MDEIMQALNEFVHARIRYDEQTGGTFEVAQLNKAEEELRRVLAPLLIPAEVRIAKALEYIEKYGDDPALNITTILKGGDA